MSARARATEAILSWIDQFVPGGENKALYEKQLNALTDEAFHHYMEQLRDGTATLSLVVPNLSKNRLSVERNFKIAEKLNYSLFQRLWLTDPHTGTTYLTPLPYLVVDLPLRRQAQMLSKKTNIPQRTDTVDVLSGQPVGPSKGGSLSFPELQTLYAQGLERTIEELAKFRGGDEDAYRAMNRSLIESGNASLDRLGKQSRVKSTETLSAFLKAAHLQNNL
jgi:hypothetical protein